MSDIRRSEPALLSPRIGASAGVVVAGVLAGLAAAVLVAIAVALALAQPIVGQRLAGSMTVVVSGRMDSGALESSDAAAARAREVLAELRGVSGVRVLEPARIDPVLARIMAAPPSSGDTGPPRLVAVSLDAGGSAGETAVAHALAGEGVLFTVDDHGPWTGPCERLDILCGAAVGLGLLGALAALAAVACGATGHRIDGAWQRLDVLAQFGADPARLARAVSLPMTVRSVAFAAAGAVVGAGLCWLRWPAAAAFAPPAPLVVAGAAAWVSAAGSVAAGLAHRVADRRLRVLFS